MEVDIMLISNVQREIELSFGHIFGKRIDIFHQDCSAKDLLVFEYQEPVGSNEQLPRHPFTILVCFLELTRHYYLLLISYHLFYDR